MKAVILAGGFGSRLSEETVVKPKPMPVTGRKPERILELNAERWKSIEQKRLGAVELFAKKRLLPPADLRQLDVVDMDAGY